MYTMTEDEVAEIATACPAMNDSNGVTGYDESEIGSEGQGKLVEVVFVGLPGPLSERTGKPHVNTTSSHNPMEEVMAKNRTADPFLPVDEPITLANNDGSGHGKPTKGEECIQ